ncbi:MAG: FKBP-type peptidyl-prolyl cis-trans isomerase [Vicinamibacterales bacterium]
MLTHATRTISLALLALVAGCNTEGPTTPITFVGPASLVITDLRTGAGETLAQGQQATVHYALWLYDPRNTDSKGTLLEDSRQLGSASQGFTIRIATDAVIEGWVQGLPGMKVGGLRRLVIPPSLAFGDTGSQGIPPNAWLVFDVDLLAVRN